MLSPYRQVLGPPTPLQVAAGVYTVWIREDQPPELPYPAQPFVYAGYSGRSLTADKIEAKRAVGEKRKALWERLHNHTVGRRSGDQFAVYVADRFVLPTLSVEDIADITHGRVSMDEYVRTFVAKHLAFRWGETPDGKTALEVERLLLQGEWEHGTPLLNST